ncbi:hypothetical protein [Metapseudomonas furukawaii]|uniref:hypothetical protein n=1 Tax=Metapseudomonas furukawaii TaxID=1149133 RepID=UPI000569745E|nr:hypothetical protein [Pseudomonas furukawaii]
MATPQENDCLTPAQLDAVARFAKGSGRNWKAKLANHWAMGTDETLPDGALLRQLRNGAGPLWLRSFNLSAHLELNRTAEAVDHKRPPALVDLLEASQYGSLAHSFAMVAVREYARSVCRGEVAQPAEMQNTIPPSVWHGIAVELADANPPSQC